MWSTSEETFMWREGVHNFYMWLEGIIKGFIKGFIKGSIEN